MAPTEPDQKPIVVVGAILRDARNRVLVAQRPTGKTDAGFWEFPGGKCEAGEDERSALVRELQEELGIEVTQCEPLPHFRAFDPPGIRLSFWLVTAFQGSPWGREGQAILWLDQNELAHWPLLLADRSLVPRLRWPPLYLISDAHRLGEDLFTLRLEEALQAGARLVQLREPWPLERLKAYAGRLRGLCATYGASLLVNGPLEAVADCADGVHLSSARLMALSVPPTVRPAILAASCHTAAEIQQAVFIGCDFVVLSPVCSTISHPGVVPLGWTAFERLAQSTTIPIYALGGMVSADRGLSHRHGAQGIAVKSAVFAAEQGGDVVRQALECLSI